MFNTDHTNFVVADTTAPFDFIKDNGYYTVNGKVFCWRVDALQEATRTNTQPQWHFNDSEFSKVDWRTPTGIPITELYRMRAQQLRNKYDYLVVAWSGGADSTTIVDSFLQNNIPLDEILIAWPVSQSKGKYTLNGSVDASNMPSEWDYTIQPKIDFYQRNYPKLKITVCDYLQDDLKLHEDVEDTVYMMEKYSYVSVKKYRAIDDVINARNKQYNNVALIGGIAPAQPIIVDDYFAIHFFDSMMNSFIRTAHRLDGSPRRVEFFYSSPDFPELMKEQAHLLYNYFSKNTKYVPMLSKLSMQPDRTLKSVNIKKDTELLRHIRKGVLYPNWDLNIFQVNKPELSISFCEWYSWFYNNPHAREFIDPWTSAVRSQEALIDSKYFVYRDGQAINYKIFTTKPYIIGKLNLEN